jgi:hypothetical protein
MMILKECTEMENKKDILLSREEFKRQVFGRTSGKCCVPGCECAAVDAHHIMDRKFWSDGGYYLTNGAALCSKHHLDAEQGRITPTECLNFMGIEIGWVDVPDKLREQYSDIEDFDSFYRSLLKDGLIDKWGK